MPPISPPIYWLFASSGLTMRPAAKAARHAANPHLTEIRIDPDLDEDRAIAHAGLGHASGAAAPPSVSSPSGARRAITASTFARVAVAAANHPVGEFEVLDRQPGEWRCLVLDGKGRSASLSSLIVAISTAGAMLEVTCEPPENGPSGRSVSPSSTVTCEIGSPSASAAIWPSAV